jgi:1-pyrroline-5-carboxylate dehydrogenase
MSNGFFNVPIPRNEPILNYGPGSAEKKTLKAKMAEMKSQRIEIPLLIGGEEVRSGNFGECRCPHEHAHLLATYHQAGAKEVEMAVQAARNAWPKWSAMPWQARAAIFLKAADLLAGPFRSVLNAATMLGQSKTVFQAEIDSGCELIDFYRFNPYYMQQIYQQQPNSAPLCWNYLEHRPLEGFVFAVTPFNFTSIAGNLPTSPAIMGNTVLWKPASSAVYSAYFIMQLLKTAGLPDGVINLIPGSGSQVGNPVLASPYLAGIHFTGSTPVFHGMWRTIGMNIDKYHFYPRIVGETGGKDFIFVHRSARIEETAVALIRGAFEYQGQKCSAASRAYIPESIWPQLKARMESEMKKVQIGSPEDFRNFMCAVIDKAAFASITSYIEFARNASDAKIIMGGKYDDSRGYFIEPTVVLTSNPQFKLMEEEIFGPVLTLYVYPDNEFEATLNICNSTSPYALTGAIIATDRQAIVQATEILTHAAGNFYINDKPTGAVVGQQPFGGGRASGTNDKAGSMVNLLRWTSPRSIKENFVPPTDVLYPYMNEA